MQRLYQRDAIPFRFKSLHSLDYSAKMLRRHISLWLDKLPQDIPLGSVSAGDLQTRIEELEKELRKAKSKRTQAALGLVQAAWEFADNGQLTRAEEFFARATDVAPEPPLHIEYARFLSRIGLLDKAEVICEELLDIIARAANDRQLKANALGNLGIVYRVRGDLKKAERMHRKALEIDEILSQKKGMAIHYGSLGVNPCSAIR